MKQTLNEQIGRIKSIMNINEDDSMAMLQQDAQEFNEKIGEELAPEEFKEVMCSDPETLELPNMEQEQMQVVAQLKEKMKTASFAELMQLKKQLKQLKQQNEQVAAPAAISLLGVSMSPGVAIAVGMVLFVLVLSFLGRLFRTKRTTYYCDGTRSRGLFGLLRW